MNVGLRVCIRFFSAVTSPTYCERETDCKMVRILSPGLYPHLLQSMFSSLHSVGGGDFPSLELELGLGLVLTNRMRLPPREQA